MTPGTVDKRMKFKVVAYVFSVLTCCWASNLLAQNYNNTWYFGHYAGIDFNVSPPVKLTNSAMSIYEGCTSLSDPNTGQILFYTNGDTIWNRNHVPMPNGFGLGGHYSTTQSAVAVPDPGNPQRYYVFTVFAQANEYPPFCCGSGGLNLNIVDMTLDGGFGDVTIKNQLVIEPTTEKVAAVKQCNNIDYWIITHQWNNAKFNVYPLTAAGLGAPVISDIGMVHSDVGSGNSWETIGHLRVSPDGSKLALAASQQLNRVEVFDFDDVTGVVSNMYFSDSLYDNICGQTGPYGVCFSPDGTKLYTSVNASNCTSEPNVVYQYDLSSGNGAVMMSSRTVIKSTTSEQFGALQIGPDGRIYVAKLGGPQLDVIQSPNVAGNGCTYSSNAFNLNTFSGDYSSQLGLPNVVESLLLPKQQFTLSFEGCLQTDTILFLDTIVKPPYTIAWDFGDPASSTNSSNQQNAYHAFTTHDIYNVTLYIYMPCDTYVITKPLNTIGSLAIDAGPDTTLCVGNSYAIPIASGTNYSWTPADGLSCTNCANPVATPLQTTTYIVNVNTPEPGCEAADTIVINVIQTTPLEVSNDTVVCLYETVQLFATGGSSYSWTPSDGLNATDISNPIATVTNDVTYTVIGSLNGCAEDTQTISISTNPLPSVDAGTDGTIYEGQSIQLNATTTEALFVWQPASSLSDPSSLQPTAAPDSTTVYTITVTDENNCTAFDTVHVEVIPEEPFIIVPNAFSPNGDGINDELAYFLRNVQSLSFSIYNRWGELVFTTNEIGSYWNGIYKRYPQPVGVYVYTATAVSESGKRLSAKGNFTLLR